VAEFDGQTGLVTGGGSGIGRQVAIELARLGARVLITDISPEGANQTAQMIRDQVGEGTELRVREMDVANESAVIDVVAEAEESFGQISLLCNCAGVSSMIPFLELTEKDWDHNMNINAKGVFFVTREVLKAMVPRRSGAVVSIASAAAKGGSPELAHYCASKWAVLGLTQSAARAVAEYGIRVNAVCPGLVRTPMQDREVIWEGQLRGMDPEQVRKGYVKITPLGRLCEPEDVADVMMFLLSDKARFMTGQAVNVTGGLLMH
jgi:meso-butanediol dehydrogenase / (S,S)-butanediol dehydrogenase / diacetyl reductase